jgi:hypothetical protein
MRKGDHAFLLRTPGLGMPGTVRVGTVVELAGQLDGPIEGIETSLAMVTDMHPATAGGTVPVDDIELPRGEFHILGPGESHGAALRAVWECEQRDMTSLSLCSKSRDF